MIPKIRNQNFHAPTRAHHVESCAIRHTSHDKSQNNLIFG